MGVNGSIFASSGYLAHIGELGNWISDNIFLFLLIAGIAFLFHLFRPHGFAEKFMEYRLKQRELDAKQLDDARAIANILRRKFEIDEPLLPFDDETPLLK